jgi:uncharacterized protein
MASKRRHNPILIGLKALIKGYAYIISPLTGAKCRFYPTCSTYAQGCLDQHGVIKGLFLTAHRLLRCHPWYKGPMMDPVPSIIDWGGILGYKRRQTQKPLQDGCCDHHTSENYRKDKSL